MEQLLRKTRVMVVEDEIVVSEDLQQRLVKLGFDVVAAADTAVDAILLAKSTRPDVALMDIMLHGRPEGIDAAEHLRDALDIPVIYLTAHSDSATLQRAKLTDPAGYIVKPFDDAQLRAAVELAPLRAEMERKARSVSRWMSATLTSIGDAVIATNVRAEILLLNPAAERLTGWTQNEAVGKPCSEVLRLVNLQTRHPMEDPAARALNLGVVVRLDQNTVLISRTGDECYVDDSASPIFDSSGKVLGAVVVLVDASDRIAAQERVVALTQQMSTLMSEKEKHQVAGAELETFVAAVSHDLRAPLQAISSFSDLLTARHRHSLDESGQLFLDHIHSSARQMNRMMEDYLRFLGAGRQEPLHLGSVDIKSLLKAVFTDLSMRPGQKPVQFLCENTLPHAWADEAILQLALTNLIGNAIKYSSNRERPIVEVGARPGADVHTFFVRDNGAGLDLSTATKLFEPFQRFHSEAEFSGTGVGLAIVKRIVEHHGGKIWVESQPDAGATFYFTLPAVPAPVATV